MQVELSTQQVFAASRQSLKMLKCGTSDGSSTDDLGHPCGLGFSAVASTSKAQRSQLPHPCPAAGNSGFRSNILTTLRLARPRRQDRFDRVGQPLRGLTRQRSADGQQRARDQIRRQALSRLAEEFAPPPADQALDERNARRDSADERAQDERTDEYDCDLDHREQRNVEQQVLQPDHE